jgi:hypothetical protein
MAKKTTPKKPSAPIAKKTPAPATKKTPAAAKQMPKAATKTKQGAAITAGEVTLTIQGKKKVLKVYTITVKGTKLYAVRRRLASVDNAKYLPLAKFEDARSAAKPRKTRKKKVVVAVALTVEAQALVPIVAKLQRGEIRLLAVEALKYKHANAKQIKAQIKVDKLKVKRDVLQKQIDMLENFN